MAVELALRYAQPSRLTAQHGLQLSAFGRQRSVGFFDGFLEAPVQSAAALLAVAKVARTRFFDPGRSSALLADPVVTSESASLRFESFSGCAGVHARFDVLAEGLDAREQQPGTVNVDFNPPMREALARIVARDSLRLRVGQESVEVSTLEGTTIERRVPLPERWFKGFSEVQVAASWMTPILTLDGAAAARFLRALPRGAAGRRTLWATPTSSGARLSARATSGAAVVAAPERLRVLEPLTRFVTALRAFGTPGKPGATAWVAEMPGARFALTISPDFFRGFSGEGGLLYDLADETLGIEAEFLDARLHGEWRFTPEGLDVPGLAPDRLRRALTWLGASGRLGYDVTEGVYFRRELPFPPEALSTDPPRLRDARALQRQGAVSLQAATEAIVRSGEHSYAVRASEDGPRCTCPWWSKHPGNRGPCKHLLAVALERQLRARPQHEQVRTGA